MAVKYTYALPDIPLRAHRDTPLPDTEEPPQPQHRHSWKKAFLVGMGIMLVLYLFSIWVIAPWWMNTFYHWQYGNALIVQDDHDVGHGGVSHFLSYYKDDRIVVIELVGDPIHMTVFVKQIRYSSSVRPVVTLTYQDTNHDGKIDTLICINGDEIGLVLLNTGNSFQWSS